MRYRNVSGHGGDERIDKVYWNVFLVLVASLFFFVAVVVVVVAAAVVVVLFNTRNNKVFVLFVCFLLELVQHLSWP